MLIMLPFVGPYDWRLTLRMIGAHAVPGAERQDRETGAYTRVLDGLHGPLAVTVRQHRDQVSVLLDGDGRTVVDSDAVLVTDRVRHWLDLDLDPAPLLTRFGDDAGLGPLIALRPGLRRIRYPDAFEAVVSTVLGQQVSLAAARTFSGRLTAAYGTPGPQGLRGFPRPGQLIGTPVSELQSTLGITGSRARTVLAVAELFSATGDWPVPLPEAQWDTRTASLLAVPGIGPWTAAYLRMRLLGDPDAVPVGDLVLRRALGVTTDRAVALAMEQWRPHRAYATFQLWASTAW